MRLTPALAATLLALAAGGAALAQPRLPVTGAPPSAPNVAQPQVPDELTRQTAAQDQAQADAMTARLNALNTAAAVDEARMTQLRDWDLAISNARIRAIRPVLPYHGFGSVFPHFYFF